MSYQSTRSNKIKASAWEAISKGLADDGGLFVDPNFEEIHIDVWDLLDKDYVEVAVAVMKPWLEDMPIESLRACVQKAYASTFDCKEVAPLHKLSDSLYVCELYHGRTSAFKDVALSLLPYLMKEATLKSGNQDKICILTATSGDTGKAALEGFRDVENTYIIVFYPLGGVSETQERQMRTSLGNNVCVCGVDGNFDDAQSGVKRIVNDGKMKAQAKGLGFHFSSANSINIGRLLPQITYYFTSYVNLCKQGLAVGELVDFAVPSGNFGNILAGYLAKRMGLPIGKLLCASNSNNVLFDFLSVGRYERNRELYKTISPSMDILLSSNLERLLYYATNGDNEYVASLMKELETNGSYAISEPLHAELLETFYPSFASDKETKEQIKNCWEQYHYLIDPHTAVGYKAIQDYWKDEGEHRPCILLSTASPYKFVSDVGEALGLEANSALELSKALEQMSGQSIPQGIRAVYELPIRHSDSCSVDGMDKFVQMKMEEWQ